MPTNSRDLGRWLVITAALSLCISVLAFADDSVPSGPRNAAVDLIESPLQYERSHAVGESVACMFEPPGSSLSLFGIDRIDDAASPEFILSAVAAPFEVYRFDEDCNLISSWSTIFGGATLTGIAYDASGAGPRNSSRYYAVNPSGSINGYNSFTGIPTGIEIILPATMILPGPITKNPHVPGDLVYVGDLVRDVVIEIDLATGSVGCSFVNPDNSGEGAFGNGVSEAADPAACGGATLVMSSGTPGEGQVTRATQLDCVSNTCRDVWDLATPLAPFGETFVNGIEEYRSAADGDVYLMAVGNATRTVYKIDRPSDARDCQGRDDDMELVFVNGQTGTGDFVVEVESGSELRYSIAAPPAGGPGRYVVHLNAGSPDDSTLRSLPSGIGTACFDLLVSRGAMPISIWNCAGKTRHVGESNDFGSLIPDPATAPADFDINPLGDPVNYPVGSTWTLQGVIANPAASSPRGASLTNAVIVQITPPGP